MTGQMSIITAPDMGHYLDKSNDMSDVSNHRKIKLKKLTHQASVRISEICSILLFLDLPDSEQDLDQGVYPLVVDLIPKDLTDIVLPGEEEELMIADTVLSSDLLTIV